MHQQKEQNKQWTKVSKKEKNTTHWQDLGEKLITAIKELDEAKQVIKELEDKVELLTDELKKYKQLNRKKEE